MADQIVISIVVSLVALLVVFIILVLGVSHWWVVVVLPLSVLAAVFVSKLLRP